MDKTIKLLEEFLKDYTMEGVCGFWVQPDEDGEVPSVYIIFDLDWLQTLGTIPRVTRRMRQGVKEDIKNWTGVDVPYVGSTAKKCDNTKDINESISTYLRRRVSFKDMKQDIDNLVDYELNPCEFSDIGDFVAEACDILTYNYLEELQVSSKDKDGFYIALVDLFEKHLTNVYKKRCVKGLKESKRKIKTDLQIKKINISFKLWTGKEISENITLAMSSNSQDVFKLGNNIEKYSGLSLKDAKKRNETPFDTYIYGLVGPMNDGQDIYFWTNGKRLAGSAEKLGVQTAIVEQLSHEGLHLTRAILSKSEIKDKFPDGDWPSVGEQDNDTIEEEELTTSLSHVIEAITPSFIEMAKKYIPELKESKRKIIVTESQYKRLFEQKKSKVELFQELINDKLEYIRDFCGKDLDAENYSGDVGFETCNELEIIDSIKVNEVNMMTGARTDMSGNMYDSTPSIYVKLTINYSKLKDRYDFDELTYDLKNILKNSTGKLPIVFDYITNNISKIKE